MSLKSKLRPLHWKDSIKTRLALWYGGVFGTVLILLGVLVYFYLSKSLYANFDLSLQSTAQALAGASSTARPPSEWTVDDFIDWMNSPESLSKFFHFFDPSGHSRFQSRNLPKQTLPLTSAAFNNAAHGAVTFETFFTRQEEPIRVLTYPVIQNGRVVNILQVGGSLRQVEDLLKQVQFTLLSVLPTLFLLALAGGWLLARKALQPVDAMAQVARQITAGNRSRRIPVHQSRDELGRLAETFNAMIEELDNAIQQIRQFSADASHELRTPLTILKGETEFALRQARNVEEYQQTLASGLEEIDRISRIVEELFLLSKADLGEARLEMKPVALALLIADTVSQMELLAKEKELTLEAEPLEPLSITGDGDRLRELLLNLIENAIRYTPSPGKIALSLRREKGEAVLTVSDTGIGIPKEALPKIFDRFYRSDEARALHPKGSGLGLSICQWIVHAHQGKITAASEARRGTTFQIRFPLTVH
ncbi:MAG TPA: heavy metal sensor histidine kinase [Candidatus Manganitrophaceae bacterium]|nr:heavy metal sensor histidine kinase [Candidatus Manganitrophaceae bacterium]